MSFNDWKHNGKTYQLKQTPAMDCDGCAFWRMASDDCPSDGKSLFCEEGQHAIWVEKIATSPKQTEMLLPTDAAERKKIPIVSGVLDYFPLAIAEVAKCSLSSNEQHNPGQPLHWNRTKSTDHIDCIGRHIIDRGKFDDDGQRHSAKLAWRALALLQLELENEIKKGN